jgi:PQQ-like domain
VASAADYATAVAVSRGRVFVTGVSSAGEILTVALDATSGSELWHAAAPGNGFRDQKALLALSPDGANVYVALPDGVGADVYAYAADTGAQLWSTVQPPLLPTQSTVQTDFPVHLDATSSEVLATINKAGSVEVDAYTAGGQAGQAVKLWTYSGPPTVCLGDQCTQPIPATLPASAALSPDGGTLYVFGTVASAGQSTWSMIAIGTTAGAQLWQVTPAGDVAVAIAASPNGTTLVASGRNGSDMQTLALNASDGSQAWAAVEQTPSTNGFGAIDSGASIALSSDSTMALVGGYSDEFYDPQNFHKQYLLRAYSMSSGASLWATDLPGPDNYGDPDVWLALSTDGGILGVTTRIDGVHAGTDYQWARYGIDPMSGAQLWTSTYAGSIGGDNSPSAITAMPGAFVVTGYSEGGITLADYVTQAINLGGGVDWSERRDNIGAHLDELYSGTLSPDGSTEYMTGLTVNGENNAGLIVAALTIAVDTATGAERWRTLYDPAGRNDGEGFAVAVSPDGARVFVTGQGASPNGGDTLTVLALDAATGATEWVATPTGNYGLGVEVSRDGALVYVMGSSSDSSTVVVALDAATGAQRWWIENGSVNPQALHPVALSADGTQLAITGTTSNASGTGASAAVLDLTTADGHVLWTSAYDAAPGEADTGRAIAFRPDGGAVYITGDSNINQGTNRYLTVAFDTRNGSQLWAQLYFNGDTDAATALAVAPDGSTVYVTGASVAPLPSRNEDFATIAYDSTTGAQEWLSRYSPPGNDLAEAIRLSPDGSRIYVAGQSEEVSTGAGDSLVVVYDTSGTALSTARWTDTSSLDYVLGLDVSGDGSRLALADQIEAGSWDYLMLSYQVGPLQAVVPEAPVPLLMLMSAAFILLLWRRRRFESGPRHQKERY